MSWVIYLVLVAFILYTSYNIAALSMFGIKNSLSQTFYEFKNIKPCYRFFFPIMMISMGFLLIPAWLVISEGSNYMFTAFFAATGIIFTGSAPAFNRNKLEDRMHTGSAYFATTFALLWIILVTKLWWVIIIWGVIILFVALLTKTLKSSIIYWLETVTFLSTFTSIIIYFVAK